MNVSAYPTPADIKWVVLSIAGLEIEAARSFALSVQGGFHHEPRHSTAVDWKGYLLRRLDRIGMWRLVSP